MTPDITIAPPNSPQFEKSVLSLLLQYPEMLDEAPNLTSEHFYANGRPELFRRIVSIIKGGDSEKIDSAALIHQLASTGALDRIGGQAELSEVWTYQPYQGHFKKHIGQLNEFLARRMAMKASMAIYEACVTQEDVTELVDAISAPITAIHETLAEAKAPASTKSLIKDSLQRYLDRVNGKESIMGIPTGIAEIDMSIRGLRPGRTMVIGAYPSGGKSILASQIMVNVVRGGFPGAYLALEMSEGEIMDRFMIQAGSCPAEAFTDPKGYAETHGKDGPTEGNRRKIESAAMKLIDAPLMIRKVKPTLQAFLSATRKAVREIGAKVVVWDYIQPIRGTSGSSKEQELSEISRAMMECAGELQIQIIVLSQISADGDTKHGRVIEEDADAFLLIAQEMDKKKKNFKEHQHVLIVKDRHYSQGGRRLPLVFDAKSIMFVQGFPESAKKDQKIAEF